jgi:purine-binding chemotaxis protein CheW
MKFASEAPQLITNKFLSFKLGEEEYGIEIEKVQEIRGYETVTSIPNSPDFLKGVMNLRGVIVPVVDLRIKFSLGISLYDALTVVIILNIEERVIGAVVDSVSDVVNLTDEQIKPAGGINSIFKTEYLTGFGAFDERMLILIDIDRLMTSAEMGLIDQSTNVA